LNALHTFWIIKGCWVNKVIMISTYILLLPTLRVMMLESMQLFVVTLERTWTPRRTEAMGRSLVWQLAAV
jgi:hypothetical protein